MKVPAVIQRTLDGAAGVRARIGLGRDRQYSQTDVEPRENNNTEDHEQVGWPAFVSIVFRSTKQQELRP